MGEHEGWLACGLGWVRPQQKLDHPKNGVGGMLGVGDLADPPNQTTLMCEDWVCDGLAGLGDSACWLA